jgi:putative aldouronate transport system permease protein
MAVVRSKGEKIFSIFNYVFLSLFSFLTMYPFINIIAVSFSGKSPIGLGKVNLLPKEIQFRSYTYMFEHSQFWGSFRFTTIMTLIFVVISVVFTCIIAYPISKKDFKLKGAITIMIVFTMFFSGGLIPEFLLYKALNMYDTVWVLLIPGCVSTWSLLILRNFFAAIPDSIEESALIDGANELQILFRIVIPMSMPVIATITLWYAVGEWNQFFQCIMFTTKPSLRTLQVALRAIVRDTDGVAGMSADTATSRLQGNMQLTPQSVKAVAIVLTTLPIMLVYPFLQKYFVKGVIVGSLKG